MDSAAGAPLEEIRYQAQKEVETNYLIMTERKRGGIPFKGKIGRFFFLSRCYSTLA